MDTVSTYLGPRGYTIFKDALSVDDQRWVRTELHVTPYIQGSPQQPVGFDVYRESTRKLYIPRAFGIANFGAPDKDSLGRPVKMDCAFTGALREYQVPVVKSFLDIDEELKGGIIDLPCGYGKTSCALYIAAALGVRTLVIVHKTFLMNQWEERIHQFLPSARVGRIQGECFEIEDCDIVLGMLQSLSMKEYATDAFTSFGTTIIDECHHIPSEVFSRALNKVVTRNILGLSATVERKDGLTKVLGMFIGPVIYSQKRKPEPSVLVRKVDFVDDRLKGELKTDTVDWRGNVKYSTILCKLCECENRTRFLYQLIAAEIALSQGQQILVLAQFKSILVALEKLLESGKIEFGYYVGGMRRAALDASSKCDVILATYGMAAEGLDIKTLTTLFLVTPRTDIVQSVGRILRSKHERPLIVDIVDPHPVLQRQWSKRAKYYKDNEYMLTSITSDAWERNEEPKELGKRRAKFTGNGRCLV